MTQAKPTVIAAAKAEHRDIECRIWGHKGSSETLGAQGRILSGREYPGKGSVIAGSTRKGQSVSPHPGTEAPLLVIEIGGRPATQ